MGNYGVQIGGDDAQAHAVDKFMVPEQIKGRAQELAGARQQVEVEEGVAIRIGRRDLLRKDPIRADLVA